MHGYAVIDVCLPNRAWKLKQTQACSAEIMTAYNAFMLELWDRHISDEDHDEIIFVSSCVLSYSICNLMEQRRLEDRVFGICIISPTLFLPVASQEKGSWYARNSVVIVPTRMPAGTRIPTNVCYGSCYSSGSDDPIQFTDVVADMTPFICSFVTERIKAAQNDNN